jgi:hypothetical protein
VCVLTQTPITDSDIFVTMAKRSLSILVLLILATVSAALIAAAPRATLTLRNGDKLQTELVDLGGVGFTIRSGAKTETISEAEVAFIDFAGAPVPAAEINAMQNGNAFVALRNGDVILGRLIDIGGNDPLRLTVRTSNGNQDFSSNDVARIFLAKWNGMPAPAAVTPPTPAQTGQGQGQGQGRGRGQGQNQNQAQGQGRGRAVGQGVEIVVVASDCWVRTGIFVDANQRVAFATTGQISLSLGGNDVATAAGSTTGRYSRNAPIPNSLVGALIGRIDNRRPFGIGNQTQGIGMPDSGELWLGINDDRCRDDRGEFRVRVDDRARLTDRR